MASTSQDSSAKLDIPKLCALTFEYRDVDDVRAALSFVSPYSPKGDFGDGGGSRGGNHFFRGAGAF